MKKYYLFLLFVLIAIGNLPAQTRATSRDARPSYPGYQGQQQEQQWQSVSEENQLDENLSSPLMMGIEKGRGASEEKNGHLAENNGISRGRSNSFQTENNGSAEQARGTEANPIDQTSLNNNISVTKTSLEQNREALETEITSIGGQRMQELLAWQEIIKQRHHEFLFQAAFSVQHAQVKAQENANFFSEQVRDLQKTIGTEEPAWVAQEEQSRMNQVRAFREKLQKIEPLLNERALLYQRLADTYAEKIEKGSESEGIKNILSPFEEIGEVKENDPRQVIGEHDLIGFVAAAETTESACQEGRTLVETGIMQIYGIAALQRFRETFHAAGRYSKSLSLYEVKKFIEQEDQRARNRHPDSQRNYFFSSIDSLDKLQRLAPAEYNRLIRSNDHQLHFNPYSEEIPSLPHVTDPDQTKLQGAIAIRASLRKEDFFKKATPTNQGDILKRFDRKFLKQEKSSFLYRLFFREEKKIPLTIEACNRFVKEERERSERWTEKLYYSWLSKPHEINQELWSWFAGIVSGERAQPPFTSAEHFWRSLGFAVGSAYGVNVANDLTRPLRKEAKMEDDEALFESMRRERGIQNPLAGLFQNFSKSTIELQDEKQKKIQAISLMSIPSGYVRGLRASLALMRAGEVANIEKKYEENLKKLKDSRKKLALKMLERFISESQANSPNNLIGEAKEIIEKIQKSGVERPEAQEKIDQAFQFLVDQSSQVIIDERERLEGIHQSLEDLSKQDFSDNQLCSASDVNALQELFEETKEAFLLEQARFHQSLSEMDELRQTAIKNAKLFHEKKRSFERKIEGGKRTARGMDQANPGSGDEIRKELGVLEQLKEMAAKTVKAYEQLASIYSLRIERVSEEESNSGDHSSLMDQLKTLRSKNDELDKIIVSRNGTFILKERKEVDGLSHVALKQNGIALALLAIRDGWGQEGVEDFQNSTQFKRAAKEGLTLREFREILNAKFPENRPSSYFLGAGHSIPELLKSSDSENERIIKSNGRVFSYNPFSTREPSEKNWLKENKTVEEGAEEAFLSVAQLDFFKKASLLNQYHILKKFSDRFRRENGEALTVGAFKDFVKQEEEASKTLAHLAYYTFYDPLVLSQEWSGFMGLVTGVRFQPVFSRMPLAKKFLITWGIDVLGEYYGRYREYRDGGEYKKLVDAALDGKGISSPRSVDVPDFEKKLEEIRKEKESRQFQRDVYHYLTIHDDYKNSVKQVLEEQQKYVAELLANRLATLGEGDSKKATFTTALQELRESNDGNVAEKITEAMKLLTEDAKPSIDQAVEKLESLKQEIVSLANGDLNKNALLSSKDFERLQQTLAEQLAELRLEQVRAQQDPERLVELHALAVKNANFFLSEVASLLGKLDGAYEEIQDREHVQDQKEKMVQLSIVNKLREKCAKVAKAYNQLADAYAVKVIAQRSAKLPEEEIQQQEKFLSRFTSEVLPDCGKIVINDHGKLVIDTNVDSSFGLRLSDEERHRSAAAVQRLKIEIADSLGVPAVERFEKDVELKMLANHPVTVSDVRQFLFSEESEHQNKKAVYLSPAHSLDQLLDLPSSDQLLRSQGAAFRYNPFSKQQQKFISGDQETVKEGVKVTLQGLKKTKFYKKLTELNKKIVEDRFKDRFQEREKTWTRYFKSFFFEQEKIEPLTVKALQDFVRQEREESEAWHYYYQFRDSPLAASMGWNVIAGGGVLLRIDPDIINCNPINIVLYYGGHRHLLYTFIGLTTLPWWAHAVPSILIAYGMNRVADSWLNTRQERIAPIR